MASRQTSLSQAPLLEWIAGGVGLAFLAVLLGVIGYDALSGTSREPPAIVIETHGVTKTAGGYVLAFEAVNHAGGTAAALEVEAELVDGATVVETSSATIDYVSGHGSARGGFFYRHDPAGMVVRARPLGYQEP